MNDFKYEPLSLERIQAEQDKHKLGDYYVPSVDGKSFEKLKEADFDTITTAIDRMAKDIQKETDLYIICEMAKAYTESQRPAKWDKWVDERWGGTWYYCSNCHNDALYKRVDGVFKQVLSDYCPNCGKRMIIDKESNNEDNKANSDR